MDNSNRWEKERLEEYLGTLSPDQRERFLKRTQKVIYYSVTTGKVLRTIPKDVGDGVWVFSTTKRIHPHKISCREDLEEMIGFTYIRTIFPEE